MTEMQVGPFDQTWYCNELGYDIRRIKPYAAYDVGADSWVVKPPHLPHWSLSELPKPVQQVLRAADSYARRVLKLPEPERTQQGAALFEAWHSDRSRAFGPQGEGWWDIANLREKWLDQAGLWAQLVNCAHRAKQGLGAAPADWSNTPTGYVAAASRSETGAYPSRVSHHELERLVPGYDPEEHTYGDPGLRRATFSYVHRFPVRSLPEAGPTSPEFYAHSVDHDSEQEHEDYLEEMRELGNAIKQNPHSVPPIIVDHTREFPLLDGSHRSGLALHHGVEHLPAYVRDGGRERTTATVGHRVTARLPKTEKCDYCKQQATKRVIWAEGMGYIPTCDEHEQRAKDHVGDDYCNTRPIPKTAGAGSPDHRQGYEHGLVGARGNLPFIERTRARGRELGPEDHDYLAGHAAGTQEKQRRDQHRAETGEYKCQQCAGTGMGRWRGTSTCNECQGSGSISQEAAHKTDTLYHVTDNPHFTLNAHHVPEDNTVAIENRSRPGLYAAHKDDVEHWTRGEGYVRPYVAEIHVPHHAHEPGRWGGERFIPAEHFDKVKVTRIIPLSAHGTDYRGPDARDMTPKQHVQHKQDALDTLRDEHGFEQSDLDHLRQTWAVAQLWITPQLVMGSAAGLNHARQVNSASEAVAVVQQGLTAVLPPGAWFPVRQVLLGLGMSLLDVTQRLKQFGAPSSVTG